MEVKMMDIKVIDGCLHRKIFEDLVSIAHLVPYKFNTSTAYDGGDDTASFSSLYVTENIQEESSKIIEKEPLGMAVSTIVKNAVLNANMPFGGIGRLRFAITNKSKNKINAPHIDYALPHKVGLIYLNDSDGETVLYNEKISWNDIGNCENPEKYFKQPVTIQQKVMPKANRMVLFDGNRLHSSTNPVENDYRMVLNFNYV